MTSADKAGDDADKGGSAAPASSTHEDQLRQGTAEILSTAKWLVTTFGAVAGAVLAGISFSDLGKLEGSDKTIALIGAIVGLLGVVVVVGCAALVLTTRVVTLLDMRSPEKRFRKLRETLNRSPELRGSFPSIDGYIEWLDERITTQAEARKRAMDATLPDGERQKARDDLARAQKDVDDYQPVTRRLRANAQYEFARQQFRRLLVPMFAGVVAAAIGVGALALSNTGEKDETETPAVVQHPVAVTVDLDEAGAERLADTIGAECDADHLDAIAVSSSEDSLDLVTTGEQPGCEVADITLSEDEGEVEAIEAVDTGVVLPD